MTMATALKCKHQAGRSRAAARWTGFTPSGSRTRCCRGVLPSPACSGRVPAHAETCAKRRLRTRC